MEYQKYLAAAKYIQDHFNYKGTTGVILGTGLGSFIDDVEISGEISYRDIPHFPLSTAESHSGKLIHGRISGSDLIIMQGRFHAYEGYSAEQVTFPIRVMKLLGVQNLLISNAAGGIHPELNLGDLMIIEDHINLQYGNPLTGRNIDEFGPRIPDMYEAYDFDFIEKAEKIGAQFGLPIKKGVYVSVPGPNLETRAEYRFLSRIGADAVGMSTVPEVITAVHCGLRVFAVSIITDLCYPPHLKPTSLDEIIKTASGAEPHMRTLFAHMISALKVGR